VEGVTMTKIGTTSSLDILTTRERQKDGATKNWNVSFQNTFKYETKQKRQDAKRSARNLAT